MVYLAQKKRKASSVAPEMADPIVLPLARTQPVRIAVSYRTFMSPVDAVMRLSMSQGVAGSNAAAGGILGGGGAHNLAITGVATLFAHIVAE